MEARRGTWGELQVGSYMRDQTGEVWKVINEREFHLQVQNRAGEKKHLQPRPSNTPVTIMEATEAEAAATLQKVLGAVRIGTKTEGAGAWKVEAFPSKSGPGALQDARSHLFMFHGVWAGDVKTLVGLIECHEETHARPMKGHQNHDHPGGSA